MKTDDARQLYKLRKQTVELAYARSGGSFSYLPGGPDLHRPQICSCQQAGHRQILVEVGPMETDAATGNFVLFPLFRRRSTQRWKPQQWHAQHAAIREKHAHDFLHRIPLISRVPSRERKLLET